MAVDLAKNEFYVKKIMKECKVRDANKDGFLSKEDFDMVVQRYKNMGFSDKVIKKLSDHYAEFMKVLGITGPSTKVTYKETIVNFSKASNNLEALRNLVNGHFEVIDINGDGTISFDEWVKAYKAMNIDTQFARASYDAMDTSGDGDVSKEEFLAYTMEFYGSTEDKLKSSILYGPLD